MPIPETTPSLATLRPWPCTVSSFAAILFAIGFFLLTDVEQFHFAVAQKLQNWSAAHRQGPPFPFFPPLPCLSPSILYPLPFTSFVLSVFHMIFARKLLQKLFNIFCLSSKNWILLGILKNKLQELYNREEGEGVRCRASHNRINKVFKS